MNILNISTRSTGGAGIAALRLNKFLNDKKICSKLLIRYAGMNVSDRDVIPIHSYYYFIFVELLGRLKKIVKKDKQCIDNNYLIFNTSEENGHFQIKKIFNKIAVKPDVIILHWIDFFLNAKNIFELYNKYKVPILWTFMDMSPMTGGCHYAWNCKGYIDTCGRCPGLFSEDENDVTSKNIQFKAHYLDRLNIIPITCSEWTYRQAKESTLFKNKPVYKILLPVNPEVFRPIDRKSVRNKMGLPIDKKLIFFGATYLTDERKGMTQLSQALRQYHSTLTMHDSNNVMLLIAGKYSKDLVAELPFEYKYLGLIKSEIDLALAYQAADMFICPSIDDSGPLMINESIMCGTPVVAFEMGVALDLVHTGSTGYRAVLGNVEDLSEGIKYILNLDAVKASKMSAECRRLGLELCHPEAQVEAFRKLIEMHTGQLD